MNLEPLVISFNEILSWSGHLHNTLDILLGYGIVKIRTKNKGERAAKQKQRWLSAVRGDVNTERFRF